MPRIPSPSPVASAASSSPFPALAAFSTSSSVVSTSSFPVGSRATASQASSSQEAAEERWADLLKPIKDLTVNWEVPLSRYLEEYMEELGELERGHLTAAAASVQPGSTDTFSRVNFVQAALLLQGTASVYSKKVEFLWQNVLKMQDLLASRKALDEAEASADGKRGGRRRGGPQHSFSDFTSVAALVCKAVHLKEEETSEPQHSQERKDHHQEKKRAALNFISVTPR